MPQKSNTFVYLFGLIGLIVAAIVFTAIINQTKSKSASTGDFRARAAQSQYTYSAVSNGLEGDTLLVDDLRFIDNKEGKSLGSWKATAGEGVNLSEYAAPGTPIKLGIDASAFSVADHTMVITRIGKN